MTKNLFQQYLNEKKGALFYDFCNIKEIPSEKKIIKADNLKPNASRKQHAKTNTSQIT